MKQAFGIFQGGGAQGMTHVGAYAATKNLGIEFVGVAGASAGAIIAALIAVGYQPEDILNPKAGPHDPERDILSRLGSSPVRLLGRQDWARFWLLTRLLGSSVGMLALGASAIFFLILLYQLFWGGGIHLKSAWASPASLLISGMLVFLLGLAALILLVLWSLVRYRGLLDPHTVEVTLERILQNKVRPLYAAKGLAHLLPEKIRFCDIDPQNRHHIPGFVELKIAVTDLTQGKLKLFGMDHHPEASVAEVVAASISIPFVFKPARICSVPRFKDREFADGGLVSNLPVWVFREEKRAVERRLDPYAAVPVIAYALLDGDAPGPAHAPPRHPLPQARKTAWRAVRERVAQGVGLLILMLRILVFWKGQLNFRSYLIRTVRTAIFGSQEVVSNFVSDLIYVPLKSPVGVLEFDVTWDRACAAHEAGLLAGRLLLAQIQAAQDLQIKLGQIHELAVNRLGAAYQLAQRAAAESVAAAVNSTPETHPWPGRLRLLIFKKAGRTSFKVAHHYLLGNDTDDQIVVDAQSKGVPQAFHSREPAVIQRDPQLHTLQTCSRIPMSKYEFVHLWRDWYSTVCIPLFQNPLDFQKSPDERAEPIAILSLDSDQDICEVLSGDEALTSIVKLSFELMTYLSLPEEA